MTIPAVLSIAGSDSGGGAGIQADCKTFSALQTYGCTAITAITAQNTQKVEEVEYVSPQMVVSQCRTVLSDIDIRAIKIGMLGNAEIIQAVADYLGSLPVLPPVILDPVMVSTSGYALLSGEAVNLLKTRLFPLASLITPNLPEAAMLLGDAVATNFREMEKQLECLLVFGSKAVLLKGGHLSGSKSTDFYHDGNEMVKFEAERISSENTHGTGCSLSSAIAAFLAKGFSMKEAVFKAKSYVFEGISHADELHIGKGKGPIHHFSTLWKTAGCG